MGEDSYSQVRMEARGRGNGVYSQVGEVGRWELQLRRREEMGATTRWVGGGGGGEVGPGCSSHLFSPYLAVAPPPQPIPGCSSNTTISSLPGSSSHLLTYPYLAVAGGSYSQVGGEEVEVGREEMGATARGEEVVLQPGRMGATPR